MSATYLLALGGQEALLSLTPRLLYLANRRGWRVPLKTSELLVFVDENVAVERLPDDRGLLLGQTFNGDGWNAIHATGRFDVGDELLTTEQFAARVWGNYLYIRRSDLGVNVYRSAFSTLGAYYVVTDGVILISSDTRLLLEAARLSASISWPGLVHQLVWDDLCDRATSMDHVRDLRGGEAMEVRPGGAWAIHRVWNPWVWAQRGRRIEDADEAVDLIHREVLHCVGAYAQEGGTSLVDLSGGLDSSILACLLARAALPLTAFTVFSPGTEGDERRYAQMASDHAAIPLVEACPDPARVDVGRSHAAGLPRPYARSFVQEVDRLRIQTAAATGAKRFFNGGGGDNVFWHLQSSAPAADILRARGPGIQFLRTIADVAAAADCGVWEVARKAVAKSRKSASRRAWASNVTLLHPDCLTSLAFTHEPPWPTPPAGLLPGQIEHVHALYNGAFNTKGFISAPGLRGVFPLLSQPLIEACLRTPSWFWVAGGRNRAIIRSAMKPYLPAPIEARRSKGGLGSFQIALFERARSRLREMLIDGALTSNGIIDRREIEAQFGVAGAIRTGSYSRLLRLADAEAWAASWR